MIRPDPWTAFPADAPPRSARHCLAWHAHGRRPERAGTWADMLGDVVAALPTGVALTLVIRRGGGMLPHLRVELEARAASREEAIDNLQSAASEAQALLAGGELALEASAAPTGRAAPGQTLEPMTQAHRLPCWADPLLQQRGRERGVRLDAPLCAPRPPLARALFAFDTLLEPVELRWELTPLRLDAASRNALGAMVGAARGIPTMLRAWAATGSGYRNRLVWRSRCRPPAAALTMLGRAVLGAAPAIATPTSTDPAIDLAGSSPVGEPVRALYADAGELLSALPTTP